MSAEAQRGASPDAPLPGHYDVPRREHVEYAARNPLATPEAVSAFRQGQRIGRYRVHDLLATGGFARIYRAVDTERRRRVVLKVPTGRYPLREAVDDFRHEVRENHKLQHANVLPVLELFTTEDGVPVIVLPLGRASLADRVQQPLPLRRALRYAHDMLLGLAHAHRHHVLHLDVKPENLIILRSGRLALADFGTARRGHRTVVGDGTGTEGYMAPDQAKGRPSARSDVYAAGMVVSEMLWGRGGARRGTRRGRSLPADLRALVERSTDPDPRRRYADASAMLAALRRIERKLAQASSRPAPFGSHGRVP